MEDLLSEADTPQSVLHKTTKLTQRVVTSLDQAISMIHQASYLDDEDDSCVLFEITIERL